MAGEDKQSGLLTFDVGPVHCVAETIDVAAVVPPAPLSRLPGDPDSSGVFRHAGRLVRLVDLRQRFGLTPLENRHQRIIVVDRPEGALGYLVDCVDNVIERGSGRFGPTPRYVPRDAFPGTFTRNARLYLYVDLGRLWQLESGAWLEASGLFPAAESGAEVSAGTGEDEAGADARRQPAVDHRAGRPAAVSFPGRNESDAATKSAAPMPETPGKPASSSAKPVGPGRPRPSDGEEQSHTPTRSADSRTTRHPAAERKPTVSHPAPRVSRTKVTPTGSPVSRPSVVPPARRREPAARATVSAVPPTRAGLNGQPIGAAARRIDWTLIVTGVFLLALLGIGLWLLFGPRDLGKEPQHMSAPPAIEATQVPEKAPSTSPGADWTGAPAAPVDAPRVDAPLDLTVERTPLEAPGEEVAVPAPTTAASAQAPEPLTREGNLVTLILEEPIEPPGKLPQEAPDPPPEDIREKGDPPGQEEMSAPPEELTQQHTASLPERRHEGREIKREIVHVVARGDTLWAIARRYLDDPYRYPELARLSGIDDPDLIYPGDRVRILIVGRRTAP